MLLLLCKVIAIMQRRVQNVLCNFKTNTFKSSLRNNGNIRKWTLDLILTTTWHFIAGSLPQLTSIVGLWLRRGSGVICPSFLGFVIPGTLACYAKVLEPTYVADILPAQFRTRGMWGILYTPRSNITQHPMCSRHSSLTHISWRVCGMSDDIY